MTYVHKAAARKSKKHTQPPKHDHDESLIVTEMRQDIKKRQQSLPEHFYEPRQERIQMPFVSASAFKVGDVLHVDVPTRAPALFPNKRSGTLAYHIVNKAAGPDDAPQYRVATSNENGLSAEIDHCPRYPLSPETDRLMHGGQEINLSEMRYDPYYDRRSVTVVRVLERKLVVK